MILPHGTRLGSYEILDSLGAGGMGEVYCARDTRLDRFVAIKILPAELQRDPRSRDRFQLEARAVASLNHPNICALYDVGQEVLPDEARSPVDFLVMELIEGTTLARRLSRGPLPFEQLIRTAIEIASALDAAHSKGVIHRDLKPGNIMLTKSGAKLLDFGLAKIPLATPPAGTTTQTFNPALTEKGVVLGTFYYMAPELLEGRHVDARIDLFAFGAVLYEMATGKQAFGGQSQASVVAAILTSEPAPVTRQEIVLAPEFNHLVRRCLKKDPDERWQSARDVLFDLQELADRASRPGTRPAHAGSRERIAWILATVATLIAGVVGVRQVRQSGSQSELADVAELMSSGSLRAEVPRPPHVDIGAITLSRDGHRLVFVGRGTGKAQLWIYELDGRPARPLAGTESADYPFWSPDGRFLGFFADGKLKKIESGGGLSQTVADAPNPRGGTWSERDVIVFAPNTPGPLYRVAAGGGPATPVTHLDQPRGELSHRWPHFLPDGQRFLYFAQSTMQDNRGIFVSSLDGTTKSFVVRSESSAAYADPGYLFFVRENALVRQPLDTDSFQLQGKPMVTADLVGVDALEFAHFAVSTGTLVYRHGGFVGSSQLTWFDRTGHRFPADGAVEDFRDARLSRDGRRIAVSIEDPRVTTPDIWVGEVGHERKRFTFDPATDHDPVWSPDGRQIAFTSARENSWTLYQKPSNGAGKEELLFKSSANKNVRDWSRDGKFLLFSQIDPAGRTGRDVWVLPMQPRGEPYVLISTLLNQDCPRFSPNGRWVAYQSNELSGRDEIFVTSFSSSEKWQVSLGGGIEPIWSADGSELFYLSPETKVMAIEVRSEQSSAFTFSAPRALFPLPALLAPQMAGARWRYDVSADSRRFLAALVATEDTAPLTLAVHWAADKEK